MALGAMQQKRPPLPTMQSTELGQSTIPQLELTATSQEDTPSPQGLKAEELTITDNDIRCRAYELYLERGAIPGKEIKDWLQAERELLAD